MVLLAFTHLLSYLYGKSPITKHTNTFSSEYLLNYQIRFQNDDVAVVVVVVVVVLLGFFPFLLRPATIWMAEILSI